MFRKKRTMCLAVSAFCLLFFSVAFASLSSQDVADYVKMVKEGKGFISPRTALPSNEVQIFRFETDSNRTYEIDIKAKLCFFVWGENFTVVPCKSLKDGYPKIAPLITWEK